MSGPLKGIRVLDLTAVYLGPYTTQVLGDMGADIIKVEPPGGETTRNIGPKRNPKMSGVFLNVNRNKRSLAIDLQSDEGRAAILKMAESCDLMVNNMRPQAMKKLGLTYEDVKKVNPGIVYCSAYGYGKDGPYASRPAYDDMIQGVSGLADLQGRVSGGDPKYLPTVVADKTAGLTFLYAILMGLIHKLRTGEGQEVDVPMFETMAAYTLVEHLYGHSFEPPIGEPGYPRLLSSSRKPYQTKDGFIGILPYTDRHWVKFFDVSGHNELNDDPRFCSLEARTDHIDQLYQKLAEIALTRTSEEWLKLLSDAEIPCTEINSIDDLMHDEHLKKVNFFSEMDHPTEGRVRYINQPIKLSATPAAITRQTPRVGENSVELLKEFGIGTDVIDAMLEKGTLVQAGD